MKHVLSVVAGVSWAVLAMALPVVAEEGQPAAEEKPAAAAPEVTLKGVMMLEEACILKPDKEAGKQPVLFALEGTPEVAATLDDILKKNWPGDSMDATQAIQLNEAFGKRLKYYLAPCELTTKNIGTGKWGNPSMAVTGVVFEKDGKKWITPSKIQGANLKYPDKMLAPDKPLQMPGKTPLVLKVTDTQSLNCILLPSGDFLFEKPYYVQPRWQDEFPRHITFTKPLWMAEIPVTQEMWESVMTNNPSTVKDPKRPVRNITCAEANKFCQILSEKTGRKVRLPGEAEWEYAARVGTSNPEFDIKCKDQDCSGKQRGELLPVKSRQPNAWGLYDMIHGGAFEMLRDKFSFTREDAVDPYVSCEKEDAAGKRVGHWGRNSTTYHESTAGGGTDQSYGNSMIRVVVEATPEEIAEMEKAANKGK
jgi:formylglycine-generating enzyme required for sulfatase activity